VAEAETRTGSVEDQWVDEVLPEALDWQQWVREHPLPSLGVAAFVGYVVGRYQGDRLMGLAKDVVRQQLDDSISRYTGFVTGDEKTGE